MRWIGKSREGMGSVDREKNDKTYAGNWKR